MMSWFHERRRHPRPAPLTTAEIDRRTEVPCDPDARLTPTRQLATFLDPDPLTITGDEDRPVHRFGKVLS